eukprot:GHVT01002291.1.p1 GENE.GHVT01002291.1~~GHVT01002291.1.p1  ORF type:complete len:308 (-),score=86.71 GHVT01002291.1:218-1141(-)
MMFGSKRSRLQCAAFAAAAAAALVAFDGGRADALVSPPLYSGERNEAVERVLATGYQDTLKKLGNQGPTVSQGAAVQAKLKALNPEKPKKNPWKIGGPLLGVGLFLTLAMPVCLTLLRRERVSSKIRRAYRKYNPVARHRVQQEEKERLEKQRFDNIQKKRDEEFNALMGDADAEEPNDDEQPNELPANDDANAQTERIVPENSHKYAPAVSAPIPEQEIEEAKLLSDEEREYFLALQPDDLLVDQNNTNTNDAQPANQTQTTEHNTTTTTATTATSDADADTQNPQESASVDTPKTAPSADYSPSR